ncbi:peptidoglycan D,D-transpeptidase FtsI family protein [Actinomyces bowdenii]|uniref:Penicillin-binding protein 2 n=1 Tax=Actinomyces bowdenii TaxID=131109 RepID=A0A3P1V6V9_9ACTO|nr:penicillin-binding protein 2 [Actinomyces bowdenii]RRD29396.1 penicillin-binding protein 2 [Actinomyces bowdenii]
MNPSRRQVLRLGGAGLFGVLAARTAYLQVVAGPELADKAKAERTVSWVNRAPRGDITGRDGTVLASSAVTYDIGVNQVLVAQYERTEDRPEQAGEAADVVVGHGAAAAAAQLAPILGLDRLELGAALVGDSTYEIIAERVNPDTWRKIKALGIPGIEPDQRTTRTYPAGRVAGNVLGFTSEGEGRQLHGAAGLELTQDELLTGTDGRGSEEIGRTGVIIPTGEQEDTEAVPGSTVRTTLNPDLQSIAQGAIDKVVAAEGALWGVVVAMEPDTGKIVVLADSDSVDPSDPSASSEDDRAARSVQAVFEPGSVGKVVTFATAIEEGTITPEDTWSVPYTWTTANGQSFHDAHEHEDQVLTTAQVLAESSNVGTIQVGETLADEVRHSYMERFGWGEATGIEMPAESSGIISTPDQWDDRTRYTTMFGQGLATTSLQAVQSLAAIANRGVRVAPRIVDAWIDAEGRVTPQDQPEGVRVVTEATAATMTEMLIGVTQEGGTAEAASIDGYLVAGKTGTTEILTEDGTVASFVGFLPARAPALAIAVIIYRPNGVYGGTVAAPVFREVALAAMQSMGIAPDPSVIAAAAARQAEEEQGL